MNQVQFQVNAGTIAVTWNSLNQLTCIDWYDNPRQATAAEGAFPAEGMDFLDLSLPVELRDLVKRIRGYFVSGEPIGYVPWELLDQRLWTEFQRKVYRALLDIPHGETRTYAWVARRVGSVAAPRAVGQALRKNPLPILVPCHRVVSANDLGGFMGRKDPDQPEVRLKRWLIELESLYLNPVFSFIDPSFCGRSLGVAS